jgi:hypothetical protein
MDQHALRTYEDNLNNETSHVVHRHANARMIQNVLLIWLDSKINEENDTDCRNTIVQLRSVVQTIKTFTDSEKCIKFINKMKNEKACIIISGSFGQTTVPLIHDIPHVDSIFIFCRNKHLHVLWKKEFSKIKGVFTEISPICEALKQTVQQCEQNSITIQFVTPNDDASTKIIDKINPSFIFTQVLKEIISTIPFEDKHIKQLTAYCRETLADNENELKNVDILENKYHDMTPIWWYTYECFLYPMLSRGLWLEDMNIIAKMSFFINDLHHQIEELHNEQFNKSDTDNIFTVYHGQSLSKLTFEQITKTKSGLISFNNFLCASKDRRISIDFAHSAITNPDLVGIFFVMTIDPCKSTTPFVLINSINRYEGKDEVLFPMHTVFRIREIQSMGENRRLFQVDLTLTNDTDEDISMLTNRIREETFPESIGWDRMGRLLIKIHQFDKAQQIYNILLEQTRNENEKGNIYHQLGRIKYHQMVYKEAVTYYEKSLEIYEKILPSDHPDLAACYEGIGSVYDKMHEYPKALDAYEEAVKIWQKTLPPTHHNLVATSSKISLVSYKMGDYSKLLPFGERIVTIGKNSSVSNGSHFVKWRKSIDNFKKKL